MKHTVFLQERIPYHTATYYLALLQLFVYALASIWLVRSIAHRGVLHSASVAVRTTP